MEHRLEYGLSSCGSWALEHRLNSRGTLASLLCDMWDPPGSGIEPVTSTMAGGFFTTEPPGKPPTLWALTRWKGKNCEKAQSGEEPVKGHEWEDRCGWSVEGWER